ncbi:hypothetical protein EDD15DRAFT_2198932 [Pisolithus albus]|nr:hypothetical protein EDD15DRAFT_2198932 [Pisolithus albus]
MPQGPVHVTCGKRMGPSMSPMESHTGPSMSHGPSHVIVACCKGPSMSPVEAAWALPCDCSMPQGPVHVTCGKPHSEENRIERDWGRYKVINKNAKGNTIPYNGPSHVIAAYHKGPSMVTWKGLGDMPYWHHNIWTGLWLALNLPSRTARRSSSVQATPATDPAKPNPPRQLFHASHTSSSTKAALLQLPIGNKPAKPNHPRQLFSTSCTSAAATPTQLDPRSCYWFHTEFVWHPFGEGNKLWNEP